MDAAVYMALIVGVFVGALFLIELAVTALMGPLDLSDEPEPYEAHSTVMGVDPDGEDWAA